MYLIFKLIAWCFNGSFWLYFFFSLKIATLTSILLDFSQLIYMEYGDIGVTLVQRTKLWVERTYIWQEDISWYNKAYSWGCLQIWNSFPLKFRLCGRKSTVLLFQQTEQLFGLGSLAASTLLISFILLEEKSWAFLIALLLFFLDIYFYSTTPFFIMIRFIIVDWSVHFSLFFFFPHR